MKKAIFFLIPFFIFTCNQMTENKYPVGNEISLSWEFLGNDIEKGFYSSVFKLENNSSKTLGNNGWALYYNQMGKGVIQSSVTGNVQFDHINGDLVRILPTEDFILEPGQAVKISFNKPGWLIKENESPLGPYMVYNDEEGNEIASLAIQEYSVKPFPELERIYPPESSVPLPDAGWVYEQNQHQTLLEAGDIGKIIPTPVQAFYSGKTITLLDGLMIHHSRGLEKEADYLAERLEEVMGKAPAVMPGHVSGPNIIRLTTGEESKSLGPGTYLLTTGADDGISIVGGDAAGVFYGVQSLLSLIPVEAWADPDSNIKIEAVTIADQPAFRYRGMHLDIARNFIEPDAIKKLIRVMAFYKLNKLHLHITDDEGWRLEIPSLPELTEVGSYRGHTSDNKDRIYPNFGSGPVAESGVGYGSGFLSRETFIEILRYADDHHIEVIPEINFPGHARAAIYSMEYRYDRLMKDGKEDEANQFRLIDPDDNSLYNSAQNFNDNVICVCKEAPYLFYETVVDEIMGMYEEAGLKLHVMHAGGDEVPGGSWTGSPICEEFLRNHPEISGAENLQAYFEGRLFEILKEKDLVMAGWEEVAMKKDEKGQWIPNPELVGEEMLPYVWNSQGEYLDLGNRLANAGYPVILCNVTNFYFDLAYNHHPGEPGHYWGGFVNTRRAFEFIPYDVFKSTLTDKYWNPIDTEKAFKGMERLRPDARANIVGIQGQLWSEFVKGGMILERFYMPKMIGLAERSWSGQMEWGAIEDKEERIHTMNVAWNEFANVVGQREMPRLDYLFGGFNYRLPPPGARIANGKLYANIDFPGLTIRYTTDGNIPGTDSPVYSEPVKVTGKVRLRSFDTRGRGSRVSVVEVN